MGGLIVYIERNFVTSKDRLLVIDEIQKISQWSEKIKKLWDKQKREKATNIKLLLLGSSSLEIQKGLSESLTGRFILWSRPDLGGKFSDG